MSHRAPKGRQRARKQERAQSAAYPQTQTFQQPSVGQQYSSTALSTREQPAVSPTGSVSGEEQAHLARPPRKDHRLAVQAEKLRLAALTTAIRFGEQQPSVKPRGFGILLGSLAIGAVILGGTIGGSALLQWFANR